MPRGRDSRCNMVRTKVFGRMQIGCSFFGFIRPVMSGNRCDRQARRHDIDRDIATIESSDFAPEKRMRLPGNSGTRYPIVPASMLAPDCRSSPNSRAEVAKPIGGFLMIKLLVIDKSPNRTTSPSWTQRYVDARSATVEHLKWHTNTSVTGSAIQCPSMVESTPKLGASLIQNSLVL